jgi:O-antigen/teichoic acid export membrane protein
MSSAQTITKNIFVNLASDVVGRALSFIYIIIIARYLLAEGLGKYAFVFSFIELFFVFSDFGLNMILVRDVATDKKKLKEYVSKIAGLKIFLSALTALTATGAILFLDQPKDVKITVGIIALTYCLLNFRDFFSSIYQSQEKLEYAALFNILERVITFMIGTAVIIITRSFIAFMTVFLISYLITTIVGAILVRKHFGKIRPSIDTVFWKKMLVEGFPFLVTGFFYIIYFKIDTVMLSFMTEYTAVGFYNAAYSALNALYFIPGAFIAALFPVMAKNAKKNKEVIHALYQKAFLLLFAIGLPIGIGTTILSDRLIQIIYGISFMPASQALQILIWAEVIIFVSYLASYVLLSMKKQKTVMGVTIFGAVFNVILNLLLIPKYNYIGAGLATLATESAVFIVFLYSLQRNRVKLPLDMKIISIIFAGGVLGIFVYYIKDTHIAIIITTSAIIYFTLLRLFKVVSKEDISLIKISYQKFVKK